MWILLAFTGMLRPIEVFRLRRSDIVLPAELLLDVKKVYVRIRSPKMRRLRARREHVRVTCPMTVALLEAWLAPVPPDTVLFQLRPSEFRALHDKVVRFFGLGTADGVGLTPASHRGGGASAIL